jgi:hypothetical protein
MPKASTPNGIHPSQSPIVRRRHQPVAPPLRLIGLPTICGYRQSRPSIESTTSRRREWNIAGEISITSRDGQDWRLIVKQSPSVGIGGSSAH